MAHGLLIRLHHERGVPVLVVAGDLDFSTAPQLQLHGRELLDDALGAAPTEEPAAAPQVLVVDASQIDFIDSAGLGALVALFKRALALRAGFSIAGARQQLRARLASTGLDMVVALHSSADEAVSAAVGTPEHPAASDAPSPSAGGPPTGGGRPGDGADAG
jgi:anti-sigma B factor antagonist